MQLGMIGIGRMGGNMVRRLMKGGHQVIVYSPAPNPGKNSPGRRGQRRLPRWRISWPDSPPSDRLDHGPGGGSGPDLNELAARMRKGDMVIDGGNSHYINDIRHAKNSPPREFTISTWDERRDLGTGEGLLHDDRGPGEIVRYLDRSSRPWPGKGTIPRTPAAKK